MDQVSAGLPAPSIAGLVSRWEWQPLAVAAAVALSWWYLRTVRTLRRAGRPWPRHRMLLFGVGLVAGIWTTCGFPQAYSGSLFWMWTAQQLGLLLVIPLLVLFGGPLHLALAASGDRGFAHRFLRSRVVRVLGNPLIGPALVPVLSAVLFFGPLPGWSINVPPVGWVEQLVVLGAGALIVLPLIGVENIRSSLAVGLSLAIGSLELVIDAVPGIALRLHRSLSTSFFDYRAVHSWAPAPLRDQQTAGAILWCVAELIDLPFLILVFRQWLRADARDAADIDAVLEAERIARGGNRESAAADAEHGPSDVPWWLSDPAMQRRLNGR
jgi:putative membrane protein